MLVSVREGGSAGQEELLLNVIAACTNLTFYSSKVHGVHLSYHVCVCNVLVFMYHSATNVHEIPIYFRCNLILMISISYFTFSTLSKPTRAARLLTTARMQSPALLRPKPPPTGCWTFRLSCPFIWWLVSPPTPTQVRLLVICLFYCSKFRFLWWDSLCPFHFHEQSPLTIYVSELFAFYYHLNFFFSLYLRRNPTGVSPRTGQFNSYWEHPPGIITHLRTRTIDWFTEASSVGCGERRDGDYG